MITYQLLCRKSVAPALLAVLMCSTLNFGVSAKKLNRLNSSISNKATTQKPRSGNVNDVPSRDIESVNAQHRDVAQIIKAMAHRHPSVDILKHPLILDTSRAGMILTDRLIGDTDLCWSI